MPGWSGSPATTTEPGRSCSTGGACEFGSSWIVDGAHDGDLDRRAAESGHRAGQQPTGEARGLTHQGAGAALGRLGPLGMVARPVSSASSAKAWTAVLSPEGVALSVGSFGRV